MSTILALIVAVVTFLGYIGFDRLMAARARRDLTRERLFGNSATGETVSTEGSALFGVNRERSPLAQKAAGILGALGVSVDDAENSLGRRMVHAGLASTNALILYLAAQWILGPIVLVVGLGIIAFNTATGTQWLLWFLIGLFMTVVGAFGPKLFLSNLIERRTKKLQQGFPDTLDLLLVCVESGLALDASLSRVTTELGRVHPEITAELNRTRVELSLLNNRSQALQNLGERTNLIAFRYLVAALIQSERFGTSLSDTLRVMAEEYRQKRMIMAEEKAARLPVLMTVPLVFCLMPAFLLIILGPAIIGFLESGFFGK
jgi:tight adherence protein C